LILPFERTINFEPRVWAEFSTWIEGQSDLTVAVQDAAYAARMSFPCPRREVWALPAAPPKPTGGDAASEWRRCRS
jgi:hypothetical protein